MDSAQRGDNLPQGKGTATGRGSPTQGTVPSRHRASPQPWDPQRQLQPGLSTEQDLQQLLEGPLLVDFIGAVADVGAEVVGGVFFNYVTDVRNEDVFLVPLLQVFEESKGRIPNNFTT